MKTIRTLLFLSAFLIMLSCMINLYNIANTDLSRLGIYLDFAAMAFITAAIGFISFNERKKKK